MKSPNTLSSTGSTDPLATIPMLRDTSTDGSCWTFCFDTSTSAGLLIYGLWQDHSVRPLSYGLYRRSTSCRCADRGPRF